MTVSEVPRVVELPVAQAFDGGEVYYTAVIDFYVLRVLRVRV